MCMNLATGGEGGSGSLTPEQLSRGGKKGGPITLRLLSKRHREKLAADPEYKTNVYAKVADTKNEKYGSSNAWAGKIHSNKTKEKIGKANSIHQQGEKNSNYGKCWIYNLEEKISKSIPKEELDNYLEQDWVKGRKMNF